MLVAVAGRGQHGPLAGPFRPGLLRFSCRVGQARPDRAKEARAGMITKVHFHRFKQYRDETFELRPEGISLVAGGNNSGKSTLLHGLAIWEFCRTVLEMERGPEVLHAESNQQGHGMSVEEFSPLAVPSLRHLWTNLKAQKESDDQDGYTLRIGAEWGPACKNLVFGLSLANDRLFIKVTSSNIGPEDQVPRIAYLPSFAGMVDKEERFSLAIRRRRIGEGLSGSILRNSILDMYNENKRRRADMMIGRSKIGTKDLRKLMDSDPWEKIQAILQSTFGAQLFVTPFRDEYHSYVRVELVKGESNNGKFKKHTGYRKRDIMVEGSGFLQWLSVYTLVLSPEIDTVLLDEPDVHLHPSLQMMMMEDLQNHLEGKQILISTHSSEILRHSAPEIILEIGDRKGKYLVEEYQKVKMLEGIGTQYSPLLDRARQTGCILFVEGSSDITILKIIAEKMNIDVLDKWTIWPRNVSHKDRKQLFLGLRDDIPHLKAVSLRDRDNRLAKNITPDLIDTGEKQEDSFFTVTWKRRMIENYLIDPAAMSDASGKTMSEVEEILQESFSLAIGKSFPEHEAHSVILDADGKAILQAVGVSSRAVASALSKERVPENFLRFFEKLAEILD